MNQKDFDEQMKKDLYGRKQRIFIVIPAKNEEKTISDVIKGCRHVLPYANICVFDDGSTDTTSLISKSSGANDVISNPINLGKGATLRYAFWWLLCNRNISELNNDIIITMDSDGQHNPEDLPKLIEAMENEEEVVDLVVGARDTSDYPDYKKFGNKFLNIWGRVISGFNVIDSESGFRAFTVSFLKDVLRFSSSRRYAIEGEMNVIAGRVKDKVTRRGYNVKYVDIKTPYLRTGTKTIDGVMNAIGVTLCLTKIILTQRLSR